MSLQSALSNLGILALGAAIGFGIGLAVLRPFSAPSEPEVRIDTIRIYKPVESAVFRFGTIPVPVAVKVIDTLRMLDTLRTRDTVWVEVPREVREYRDSSYALAVSGFSPRLDWIETYGRTETVTVHPRWSWGLTGGLGLVAPVGEKIGFGGFIGVGGTLNF